MNDELTKVGGAVIVNDGVIRLLMTTGRTRHFFTCLYRYNTLQVGYITICILSRYGRKLTKSCHLALKGPVIMPHCVYIRKICVWTRESRKYVHVRVISASDVWYERIDELASILSVV